MKQLVIILDPAHGEDTPGKRSPDGRHREYLWSRERCQGIYTELKELGYDVYYTTESLKEIGLSNRKKAAESIITDKKKLLLSLHNNAAGNGMSWLSARGIAIYTSKGVTFSDVCADIMYKKFEELMSKERIRYYSPQYLRKDWEENFTVLMGNYSALLVEYLFQDNREDVEKLLDPERNILFERVIVESVEAINDYLLR